uniref:Uncharacterized protein n=1 Tax=Janibacter limosus TaxID=53458 RepID=A0AC61U4C7_9MICO|nr:hypothetical protein [Janibacter limosus]
MNTDHSRPFTTNREEPVFLTSRDQALDVVAEVADVIAQGQMKVQMSALACPIEVRDGPLALFDTHSLATV